MQVRSTQPNHHHHSGFSQKSSHCSPEAELIALAGSKGQLLTEHTLRRIRETLELRGVTLEEFVRDVRSHFRNNILNPSGFLINRAQRFHELSRPAHARQEVAPRPKDATSCGKCHGHMLLLTAEAITPCLDCATPEFKEEWAARESARTKKADKFSV